MLARWNSDEKRLPVWVVSPPYTEPPRRIGTASRVVPSAHPDRVWLVDELPHNQDWITSSASAMEVDLQGRTTHPRVTFPCCRTLVPDSPRGLLLQSGANLEVLDAAHGGPTDTFGRVGEVIGVNGDTVLYLTNEGCEGDAGAAYTLDVATGARRQFGGPCAYVGGGLSPDGTTIGLWEPSDGARKPLLLFAVDGDRPPVRAPSLGSTDGVVASHVDVAWDRDGRVYFAGDLYEETVWSYDPATGISKLVLRVRDSESALVYALAAAP